MVCLSRVSLVIVAGAALALAGCGQSSSPEAGVSSPAGAASAPAASASVAAAAGPGVHVTTKRYRIDIDYPHLPVADAVLAQALYQAGKQAQARFIKALPDPKKYPELANRQFLLKLDFSIAARMPAFVSVRETGMADTGGAHPIPLDSSFVYSPHAGKLVTFDDLFADPAKARQKLSKIARKALQTKLLAKVPGGPRTSAKARQEWIANMRSMIDQGTRPTPQNYSEFVVLAGAGDSASGLLLIFPPYQVAPYVYGSQIVQVPVDAFADLLKPSWRAAFDTGK